MRLISDHLGRAFELLRLERYDLALQEVQRALTENPHSAEAHICGAWVLLAQGRLVQAEQAARAALAGQPELAAAHYVRAMVLWKAKRRMEAEFAFEMALSFPSPDRSLHLVNYADFLADNLAGSQRALEIVEQALALNPVMPDGHAVHGRLLQGLGRRYEAAAAYGRALRFNPRHYAAHNNLGLIALTGGDVEVALEHFREALRLRPNSPVARANLVRALKARNPLYGRVLELVLRGASPRLLRYWRWVTIGFVGLFVLGIVLSAFQLSLAGGVLALWGWLLLAYAALVFASFAWRLIAEPIFNTLLQLDPLGRQVVEFDGTNVAVAIGLALALLGLLVFTVAALLLGIDHPASRLSGGLGIASIALILFSNGLRGVQGAWRRALWAIYGLTVAGVYAVAVGVALDDETSGDIGFVLVWSGVIIFLFARIQVERLRRVTAHSTPHPKLRAQFARLAAIAALLLAFTGGVFVGTLLNRPDEGALMLGCAGAFAALLLQAIVPRHGWLRETAAYRRWVSRYGEAGARRRLAAISGAAVVCFIVLALLWPQA